jgi:hypothetical protein
MYISIYIDILEEVRWLLSMLAEAEEGGGLGELKGLDLLGELKGLDFSGIYRFTDIYISKCI